MSDQDKINDLERKIELLSYRIDQLEHWQDFFNDEQKRNAQQLYHTTGIVFLLTLYFFQALRYTQTPWILIGAMIIFMIPMFYRLIKSF